MKESAPSNTAARMLTPIWSKPSQSPPSASTSGVKAIPTCSTSTGEAITAEPIDLTQQALDALAAAGLGNDSPAEAFVIGYQAGWQEALDLCVRIETAINNETGGNE